MVMVPEDEWKRLTAPKAEPDLPKRSSIEVLCQGTECPHCGQPIMGLKAIGMEEYDFIYFMQKEESKLIKIGLTNRPDRRLWQHMNREKEKLRILAVVPGSRAEEIALHRKFAHLKAEKREWFRPDPELIDFIKSLPTHAFK